MGFKIPRFYSSYQVGCPVDSWDTSISNTVVDKPSYLNNPVLYEADHYVKPTDNTLHRDYQFYVRIMATGGSFKFVGPYELTTGCTFSSLKFTDSSNFISNAAIAVGGNVTNFYTFVPPSLSLSYCSITQNQIV